MATSAKPPLAAVLTAKVTRKGQITIPVEMRRELGVQPGDTVRFERQAEGYSLQRESRENPFEKWRGIGNPDIGAGREAIQTYMRELRGYDEYDDLLG